MARAIAVGRLVDLQTEDAAGLRQAVRFRRTTTPSDESANREAGVAGGMRWSKTCERARSGRKPVWGNLRMAPSGAGQAEQGGQARVSMARWEAGETAPSEGRAPKD